MAARFRKNIAALAGYLPGEQPQDGGYIKLNTNENPYPPSPRVVAALKKASDRSLRLYPEPMSREIRELWLTIQRTYQFLVDREERTERVATGQDGAARTDHDAARLGLVSAADRDIASADG